MLYPCDTWTWVGYLRRSPQISNIYVHQAQHVSFNRQEKRKSNFPHNRTHGRYRSVNLHVLKNSLSSPDPSRNILCLFFHSPSILVEFEIACWQEFFVSTFLHCRKNKGLSGLSSSKISLDSESESKGFQVQGSW